MGDPGRHQLGDLRNDDAAHRVPDDDRIVHPRAHHVVGDRLRVGADRRSRALVSAATVSGKVDGERPVSGAAQQRLQPLPAPRAVAHSMNEDDVSRHAMVLSRGTLRNILTG